jgi:filamentous hemagglutinin family protein
MNTVYNMVWSESKAMWVPAPEITRRKGKQSRRASGRRDLRALTLTAGLALAMPNLAFADPSVTQLPTGGSVVAGAATITQNNAAMVINQSTNRAAIDWQSFNVGRDASVHFNQPNATSATLNRVLDSNPSQIFGQITAPGQVFLSNPNGVYFSPSASVDVGALTATTHRIGLDDFMSGNLNFERDGATGSVINEGTLEAALGGYIALLAPEVRNEGFVIAQAGAVVMAAGEQINLQFSDGHLAGVTVSKSDIDAIVENKQAVLAPEGLIILSAQAASNLRGGVVNNEGSIEASGITRDGGRIYLEASDRIAHSGAIDADGSATGDGGVVILMADLKNADSVTTVSGSITAQGGEFGGDGGFVETSGSILGIQAGSLVSISAEHGQSGLWLLDPTDVTIDSGTGAVGQTSVGVSVIEAALASGNVTIEATNDITVAAALSNNTANNSTLTLTADSDGDGSGDINVNAVITIGAGDGIALKYGSSGYLTMARDDDTNSFTGKIDLDSTSTVNINRSSYTVVHDATALDNIRNSLGGNYALATNLTAIGAFSPIGSGSQYFEFTGKFDGLGHTLAGITINDSRHTGLFGGINNSSIQNVGVIGTVTETDSVTGGLVGLSTNSQITNSFFVGSINGLRVAGGLVGGATGSTIKNSFSKGTVTATLKGGGLVGSVNDSTLHVTFGANTIVNSYSESNVISSGNSVGGLIGSVTVGTSGNYASSVISSYATGNVTNNSTTGLYTGGLVGSSYGGTYTTSYATGEVSSKGPNIGGFIGHVGSNYSTTIQQSYSTSNVYATGSDQIGIGGFIGEHTGGPLTITDSYHEGVVDAHTYATSSQTIGGFLGANNNGLIITNSYHQGAVSGTSGYIGGFIGQLTSSTGAATLQNNYVAADMSNASGSFVGGFVGSNHSALSYPPYAENTLITANWSKNFWDSELSGINHAYRNQRGTPITPVDDMVGITTAQMQAYSTFSDAGWTIGLDAGLPDPAYPVLVTANGTTTWKIYGTFIPVAYTLSDVTSGYTYNGSSQLPSEWTSTSIFGGSYNDWVLGTDYYIVSSGSDVTGFTNAATYSSLTVNVTKSGFAETSSGSTSGSFVIGQKDITAITGITASNKVYNGDTTATLVTSAASFSGKVTNDALTVATASGAFADKTVATGKTVTISGLTLGGADAANYHLVDTTASTTADITAKSISAITGITASNKVYDGDATATLVTSAASFSGKVTNDTLTVATASGAFADKTVATGKTVTISGLTLGGADASNYSLASTTASTTANITAKSVTVAYSATDKIYDGTNSASVTEATSDLISGDVVTISETASFSNVNAGSNRQVNVSGISLAGADAGNYSLAGTTAITYADIIKAPLQVAALAAGVRTYDGTAYSGGAGVSYAGFVPGDTAADLGGTLSYGGDSQGAVNAGDYVITPSGLTSDNYFIFFYNAGLRINPAAVTVSGITASNKTYDGSLAASLDTSGITLSGVVAGDDLSLASATGSFADANVGSGKTVTISSITLGGNDVSNYGLTSATASTTANITAKPLSLSITKVYDKTPNIEVEDISFSGVVTGDTTPSIQQSGVVGTSSQTAVGSIADFTDTVGITLNNGSNYTLTGSTVSGNVLPKPVFISTASATKNFGEADPAFTYSVMLNSLLSGDSLTGSVGRVAGEGGGRYLINDVTGLTNANYTVVVGNAGTLTIRRPVEVLPPRMQAAVQTRTTPDVRADVVNTQSVSVTLETALAPNTSGPGAVQVSSVSTQAEPVVEPIQLASQDVGPAVVAQENEAQAAQVAAEVAPTAPANTVAETQSSAVTTERVVEENPAQTRTQEVSGSEPGQTAEGAAAENEGIALPETEVVTVSVPKSMTTSGTGFSFELPIELQSTLTTGQPSANLLDGSPLPSWIKFVPATASFEVGSVPDSGLPIQIVVGNAMTTALVIVSEQ